MGDNDQNTFKYDETNLTDDPGVKMFILEYLLSMQKELKTLRKLVHR